MKQNYNYQRKKLILPEYGRHIQKMIDYLGTIEDREQRNHQAQAVIAVMGNLNPMLRDTADYNHKLWDHMFIMADFDLDVDSPYPIPSAATLAPIPEKIEYPRRDIKIMHYGKNVEKFVDAIVNSEHEGHKEARQESINSLVQYMRAKCIEFHQEVANDDIIARDIRRLSNNKIKIDEESVAELKNVHRRPANPQRRGGGRRRQPRRRR